VSWIPRSRTAVVLYTERCKTMIGGLGGGDLENAQLYPLQPILSGAMADPSQPPLAYEDIIYCSAACSFLPDSATWCIQFTQVQRYWGSTLQMGFFASKMFSQIHGCDFLLVFTRIRIRNSHATTTTFLHILILTGAVCYCITAHCTQSAGEGVK
jgi:hypothetical protein